MEARELNKDEYDTWDEIVDISPYGTVFHKSQWVNNVARLLNKTPKIYGIFLNGKLVGGCSFYVYSSKFVKVASSKVATTPYGGLVLKYTSGATRKMEDLHKRAINLSLIHI